MVTEDVFVGVRTPMHITEMEEKFLEVFIEFKKFIKLFNLIV